MTGAEWIKFRFGTNKGANLSHLIVVLFAVIVVITYVAYGFIGIGKFATVFLPWELSSDPELNEIWYGLLLTGITALYVVKGGMFRRMVSPSTLGLMPILASWIACSMALTAVLS